MSVSSGSDVTIPIQDSPPPPPSPYGNRNPGAPSAPSETPEPRGDFSASSSSGIVNNAYQSTENQTNGPKSLNKSSSSSPGKKNHTSIPMNGHSEKTSGPNEAVNPELINMNVLDTIPQKPQPEFGPFENFDEYFISVNQHKKFLRRGEKLYVTKDKRKTTNWKKYICWLIGAFVLASIVTVAILAAVGLIPATSSPTQVTSVELVGMSTVTSTGLPDMTISSSSEFSTSERQESTSPTTDESSASPPTQSPGFDNHGPSAAEVELTIENAIYDDDLSDTSSDKFVRLSAEVKQKMNQTLVEDLKLETAFVRVTGFSPGSVVVKMRIGWIDNTKKFEDVQRFVSTIRKLGEYDIRPGTMSYKLYNFCKANNNGCSHYCTFDEESLDFLCTCPDYLLLGEDKKTCQEISSPAPSSTAAPEIVSSSETIPEEIPTGKPDEIPEETTEPIAVIPEDPSPSPAPAETPQITPEQEATNSSDLSPPSEETPIIPIQILPNATSEVEEDPIVTTVMPDMDYNVEINPELTASQGNQSTDKFAQIQASEPSIIPIPVEPEPAGNTSDPSTTIEEIISHPAVITLDDDSTTTTTTTTTTTMTPVVVVDSIEETTVASSLADANVNVDDQSDSDPVIVLSGDLASTSTTTTTTTTEIPPPMVEVIETSANATTSEEREYDGQPSVENSDSETISQNGTNTDTNRTSRLILESQSQSEGDDSQESPVTASASSEESAQVPEIVQPVQSENKTQDVDSEVIMTTTPLPVPEIVHENQAGNGQQSRMVVVAPEDREREALAGEVIAPENNNQQEVAEIVPQITTLFTNSSEHTGHLTPVSTSEEVESVLPASGEVEVIFPTNVPISSARPRPHPGSDEFMAFSDANMNVVNALNNKKPNTTAAPISEFPSSASVETASYEVVSGDESEISSASGSHSLEENLSGRHREIEEVTTIIPISLINDTAVNNLTEHVTEDLVNTEIIFPSANASEETIAVPVTENTGSRETEHGETSDSDADGVKVNTTTIDLPQQNPIEQSKPEAIITPEILTTTPFPPTSAEHVFSTTIPILPNLSDNNNADHSFTTTSTTTSADLGSLPTTNATTTTTSSPPQFSVDNENELQ